MDQAADNFERVLRDEAARFVQSRRQHNLRPAARLAIFDVISPDHRPTVPGALTTDSELAKRVDRALGRERAKARSGSQRYDFNRHLALLQISAELNAADGKTVPAEAHPHRSGQ